MISVLTYLLLCLLVCPSHSVPVERAGEHLGDSPGDSDTDSDEEYEGYANDDIMAVYKELETEDASILTAIELLYTTYVHDHIHDVPLLTILEQEPHSVTIMVKPKEMQPNSQVSQSPIPPWRPANMSFARSSCSMSAYLPTASHMSII